MKIAKTGYWDEPLTVGHGVDEKLAEAISVLLHEENCHTVLDIGCGNGFYVKYLNERGIFAEGVDGNPNTKELGHGFYTFDLSKPLKFRQLKNWVLSLEVGEHIPAEFEDTFISNLIETAQYGIILSWAVEGQGGDGHVNCRNNDYIREKLSDYGFDTYEVAENYLRNNCSPYPKVGWWFRNTIMVFRTNLKDYYKKRNEDAI